MFQELLFKKGTCQKLQNGTLVLIDESNVSHPSDGLGVAIWDCCNGITFGNLSAYVILWLNQNFDESKLLPFVQNLIKANLLEVRRRELSQQDLNSQYLIQSMLSKMRYNQFMRTSDVMAGKNPKLFY